MIFDLWLKWNGVNIREIRERPVADSLLMANG